MSRNRKKSSAVLSAVSLCAGVLGTLIGLFTPASLFGIPVVIGLLALFGGMAAWQRSPEGRRLLAVAGTALGAIALASGVSGGLRAAQFEGSKRFGAENNTSAERQAFCSSPKGDQLERIISRSKTAQPAQLKLLTARAITAARGAPPFADCAAFALNSLARSWAINSRAVGNSEAKAEIERIRRFQAKANLRTSKL